MAAITNTLVYRIEQRAWKAAGGEGKVDALPDGTWMEATAEAVEVPLCVVEAILGDMRKHTKGKWHRPRRPLEIGKALPIPSMSNARAGPAKPVLNGGEVALPEPIRCKCRARITVVPCRTCGWRPPGDRKKT